MRRIPLKQFCKIVSRNSHSHGRGDIFYKHYDFMAKNNSNLYLSEILQEIKIQNERLLDIQKTMNENNEAVASILVFLSERILDE